MSVGVLQFMPSSWHMVGTYLKNPLSSRQP
jgi:hypothetical protein